MGGWNQLLDDLSSKAWLPDGTSATLTDAGFQAVISQRSEQELDVYIRRVITARGGRVLDDSGLTAFASLHSKEQNMRNLTQLQVELHKTPLFEDWLTFSSSTVGRMTRFSTAQVDHFIDDFLLICPIEVFFLGW